MRVILVHGWASAWSGKYDIDRLAPFFENRGHEVVQFDYGFHLLVSPNNHKWTEQLWGLASSGGLICGHSNAAVLAQRLSWIPTLFPQKVILINPALGSKAQFGPYVRSVHVFHTPTDPAIRVAGILPWHPWGWAGAKGIRTGDPRVVNHDMSKDYPVKVWDHLGVFHQPALDFYGPLIARL